MTATEELCRKKVIELVEDHLRQYTRLAASPTSEKTHQYALNKIADCRNMLYWLNNLI
jgi:hypothetical protein